MSMNQLAVRSGMARTGGSRGGPPHVTALAPVPGDLVYIKQVVEASFPVQAARTYLRRHMANQIRIRLVEAARGERVGHVREAEVHPAVGGEPMFIHARRLAGDGSPASFYTPEDRVKVEVGLASADKNPPFPLGPKDLVVLHVPVRGYTRYLPGIFVGVTPTERRDVVRPDEVSQRRWNLKEQVETTAVTQERAEALRRFLFLFQHLMTTVLDEVDQIPSLTDPITADPRFLPWIASWVSFELDASLPVHQQRELVRRAIRLYRTRGTREGVEEMVRVLTSVPVRILENEAPPKVSMGAMTLAGGTTVAERYLRGEPDPHYMVPEGRPATRYFVLMLESRRRFRARFGERAPDVLRRIARIVTAEKPAHVQFTIRFAEQD